MQDEDRFKNIEDNIKNLTDQVTTLDKLVSKLVTSLDAHTTSERDMEITIRNIDRNITDLMIKMAAGPGERQREIQTIVNPIWEHIRKNDKKLKECEEHINLKLEHHGDRVKSELRAEAKFHIQVIYVALAVLCGLGGYAYLSDLSNIKDDIKNNTTHIEQAHGLYKENK